VQNSARDESWTSFTCSRLLSFWRMYLMPLQNNRLVVSLYNCNMVFDCKCNKTGGVLEAEKFHYAIFVKSNGSRGQFQDGGSLPHGFAFTEHLDHFSLTWCQGLTVSFGFGIANKGLLHTSRDPRSHVRAALECYLNGLK
jgi:hypothetical protein